MLELLYAVPDLTVYPAETGGPQIVPNGAAPPYVSVHFVADRPLGGRLDHRSTRMRVRGYVHCVGADGIAARAVAEKVADAWLDVIVMLPGRSVYPIRSEGGRDPREDESTGRSVITISETYRLESDPGVGGS